MVMTVRVHAYITIAKVVLAVPAFWGRDRVAKGQLGDGWW